MKLRSKPRQVSDEQVRRTDAYWAAVDAAKPPESYAAQVMPYTDGVDACIAAREKVNSGRDEVEAAHAQLLRFLQDRGNLEALQRLGAEIVKGSNGRISVVFRGSRTSISDSLRLDPDSSRSLDVLLAAAGLDPEQFKITSIPKVIGFLLKSDDPRATQVRNDLEKRGTRRIKHVVVLRTGEDEAPTQTG